MYRGYSSLRIAKEVYAFALRKGWCTSLALVPGQVQPPPPTVTRAPYEHPTPIDTSLNVLSFYEPTNAKWYVVYRGIVPGFYHS